MRSLYPVAASICQSVSIAHRWHPCATPCATTTRRWAMDDLVQSLHEAACGTGDGDMAYLLREAAAAPEAAREDAGTVRDAVERCYRMLLTEPDTNGALFKAESILREAIVETDRKEARNG